jgi:hypothetical protein
MSLSSNNSNLSHPPYIYLVFSNEGIFQEDAL